jgi:hypothetical protein
MMHRLLIGYCIVLFVSCFSKQPETKKITVIYCPEINKTSFYIPKDITGVFKSKNIDGKNYEIITDSKIQIINGDFDSPVEVPIFNSISQMIFGSPNQVKINELITSELHTIRFEKKKSRKPYPSEPSENQIFIFYNTKNINQPVGRKYYVNSSDQISKIISKYKNDKKNFYIFNSPPHVVKTPKPAAPRVLIAKFIIEKNSTPFVLQAIKSPGCILKWSSKTGATVSPKISTGKLGTFKYYVSQKNVINKQESKKIEIIVEIYDKKISEKPKFDLKKFPRSTLGINKSDDGKFLTWNPPLPKKENKIIKYSLTFYDLDNNRSIIHQETIISICSYDVSTLRNKFRNGERPKNGLDVRIIASSDEYKSIEDNRHLSLNNTLKIYNCY